jgi:hypothetical protein
MQMNTEAPIENNIVSTKQTPATKTTVTPELITPNTTKTVQKQKTQKERRTTIQEPVNNNIPEITEEIIQENKVAVENIVAADTMKEPVVATQVKPIIKRPKAVHLLDIDNENRQAAIHNRNELQSVPQRFVFLIPSHQYGGGESDRKPSSLLKIN